MQASAVPRFFGNFGSLRIIRLDGDRSFTLRLTHGRLLAAGESACDGGRRTTARDAFWGTVNKRIFSYPNLTVSKK